MRIAAVGQPPVVRMKHPTTGQTQVVKGAFYVRVKREAGWTIVDDPMNVLLPEWVDGITKDAPVASVEVPEKRKPGRPRKVKT